MRPAINYFCAWLRMAFSHSFGVADAISSALGVLVPAMAQFILLPPRAGELVWQVPLAVFCSFVTARLILAPYWMHQIQDSQIASLTKAISKQGPNLECVILNTRLISMRGRPGSFAFCLVRIANTGDPSNAEHWMGGAVLANNERVEGKVRFVDRDLLAFQQGELSVEIEIKENDWIYMKAQAPIANGASVVGYMCLYFEHVPFEEIRKPGVTIKIAFMDIRRKWHECQHLMSGGSEGELMRYAGDSASYTVHKIRGDL